ncbi:MAG TPA: hypothetical protein VED02_05515, partial [Methyloceanibacter sp.]|nr:hypothetical protein [Methyloceanibacter sp.]
MAMMAETRNVPLRGALKLKFMISPNDSVPGSRCQADDPTILPATSMECHGAVLTNLSKSAGNWGKILTI